MSRKTKECRWGTITCHVAKEQATTMGKARPKKRGDTAANFTTTRFSGAGDRLLILITYPHFLSFHHGVGGMKNTQWGVARLLCTWMTL